MDISNVHAFHPSLQCSLENSNVYEMPVRPIFILLCYQESKIKKKFFIFRLLMKPVFWMKRKIICLMIVQKTMASQIMRVIFIQHPQKDHFLRNLKNRRKMKRWTNEELQVLRKSNNQKQEDSFDIFGKHIANEIRSLENANAQRWVKFKMQEIISPIQPSRSDQFKFG